jgi:hypothetical protein
MRNLRTSFTESANPANTRLDENHTAPFVQLTPPGSACSIAIGTGLSDMPPGSVKGLQMVVSDINAARAALVKRGVDVSDV